MKSEKSALWHIAGSLFLATLSYNTADLCLHNHFDDSRQERAYYIANHKSFYDLSEVLTSKIIGPSVLREGGFTTAERILEGRGTNPANPQFPVQFYRKEPSSEDTLPLTFAVGVYAQSTFIFSSLSEIDPHLQYLPTHFRDYLENDSRLGVEIEIDGDGQVVVYPLDLIDFDDVGRSSLLYTRIGPPQPLLLDQRVHELLPDFRETVRDKHMQSLNDNIIALRF